MSLTLWPAIDLQGGRCVRLRQGRADEATLYDTDPLRAARRWIAEGAEALHVVDLDGAFQGRPVHLEVLRRLTAAVSAPIEYGGGLRTDADLKAVLDAGAARAIVGTRVCADPESVRRLAAKHGDRFAVGLDARDGIVQVKGWTEASARTVLDLARELDVAGVRALIVTDISRDGMLAGVNVAGLDEVCAAVRCQVVASGGVSSADDVRTLIALGRPNLTGAIVGKALYEGRVRLADLLAAARA